MACYSAVRWGPKMTKILTTSAHTAKLQVMAIPKIDRI